MASPKKIFSLPETVQSHEQLFSNSVRFKMVFAKRDKKQLMIDPRGIWTNWFENQLCPSVRLSTLNQDCGLHAGRCHE